MDEKHNSIINQLVGKYEDVNHKRCINKLINQYENVAIVLQGGGALGSYQAGIFEGLAEAGIEPNWLAGISIGALNTAIIAGNKPKDRVEALKGFWNEICKTNSAPYTFTYINEMVKTLDPSIRRLISASAAWRTIIDGQNGFFKPRFPMPVPFINAVKPDKLSYYSVDNLKPTLEKYVDFDLLNNGGVRVSVGAVNVRTGNFVYFDNTKEKLRAEHFIASGALPPGFPAVEIDGEYYWDGGLVSNTPLSEVLSDKNRKNTLVFQIDLWSAKGDLPKNLLDIAERSKDIQYSSKTRLITDTMAEQHKNKILIKELLKNIPEELRKNNDWCKEAEEIAQDVLTNVIQLIYKDKNFEGHYKDYEFSAATMQEHWLSGLTDIRETFKNADWFQLPSVEEGFVTHDIHRRNCDEL
jgi:NTE family protein